MSGTEEHDLLGCDTVQSGESPLMLQENVLSPSSGLKSKQSSASHLLLAGFLPALLLNPEDGISMFL
jgi:hypothetical protein